MNVVACIKRVPATETQPKIAANGKAMERKAVEYMLSFYDEIAVEEALRVKEKHGGEVTVVTLGPSDATKELRECLAKGADKAVLLVDPTWDERDALATARALAERVRALGAELVLAGKVATDRDNAAVGPMLATLLGWACVTDVIELELVPGGEGRAKREADGGIETFTFSLPAVVTCQKDLNAPRYAGLKGIMAAKKKPLEQVDAPASAGTTQIVRVELPPARKEGRIVGAGVDAVPALIEALRVEAKLL